MAYLPPMNGGRLNASISTAAGGAAFGASLISTGTMNLVAGSNITLSQAGANISLQAPNAHNVSFGGNMAGAAAMVSTGTLSFYGGNNITLSQNANNVTISGPTVGGGAGSNTIGMGNLGNTTGNAGYVSGSALQYAFSGGNNITLSQSVNASSATLGFSAPSLVNGNGFSFGSNQGSVTASYTGAGYVNVSASGSNASYSALTFANANSITFGLNNGVITASASPDGIQGISAAGSSVGMGSVIFSNSNNVNFGMNGSVVTASANAAGGVALSAPGSSFSSGTVNFSVTGGGAMAIAGAGNSINFSVPATSNITGSNITISSSLNSIGIIGQPMFDAGVSNLGNTAGQTNVSGITNGIVYVGGSNVTLSQSTSNNGNATISIHAGAASIPRWEYPAGAFGPISTLSNSQLSVQHMNIPFNLTANSAKVGGLLNVNTTLSNTTASVYMSLWMGLYTLTGSTLNLMYSGSANNSFSYLNTSASATSYMTGINGMRQLTVPLGTISASQGNSATITAGDYWVAAVVNSATNGTHANNTFVIYGNNATNINANAYLSPIGSNIANARDVFLFQGIYTANTSAGPQTMGGAQINNTSASNVMRAAFYNLLYSATY